jgi:UDP-glucose 4-epimerase
VYGNGAQTRDFTYATDTVAGLVAAADAPAGEVINLGGGSRVSLLRALEVLGEVMGAAPRLEIRAKQAGDVPDTWASLDHAREVVAYEPRVSIEEGMAAEVEWLRALSAVPGFPWGVGVAR